VAETYHAIGIVRLECQGVEERQTCDIMVKVRVVIDAQKSGCRLKPYQCSHAVPRMFQVRLGFF
jgi:hypothetical protein